MQALSSLSIFPLSSLARHKYYDTPGKQLLLNFIQNFLGVEIIGFQSRFGYGSDLILFRAPNGSTLAVDCNLMLLSREQALLIVQAKLQTNAAAF